MLERHVESAMDLVPRLVVPRIPGRARATRPRSRAFAIDVCHMLPLVFALLFVLEPDDPLVYVRMIAVALLHRQNFH